jgi:hypothetical protein
MGSDRPEVPFPRQGENVYDTIQRLLDEADEAMLRGDYRVAFNKAMAVLSLDSSNAEAQNLGDAAEQKLRGWPPMGPYLWHVPDEEGS